MTQNANFEPSNFFRVQTSKKPLVGGTAGLLADGSNTGVKSYAYSGVLLDILGLVAWITGIFGTLVFLIGCVFYNDWFGPIYIVSGVSGVMLAAVVLALVQIGRAVIDIAQNTALTAARLDAVSQTQGETSAAGGP